ncbi:MAG: family 20 glycosylhydrolase [Pyrinomonadaceae bacterium]
MKAEEICSIRFGIGGLSLPTVQNCRMRALLLLLALTLPVVGSGQISIIPGPRSLTFGEGGFTLDSSTTVVSPKDKRSKEVVAFLRDSIREQTGIAMGTGTSSSVVEFVRDPKVKDDEGYRLRITPSRVAIHASDAKGFFWGVQTLRQMIPFEKKSSFQVPVLAIDDEPAFEYRGHMLDVGRHFFPVEFIKKQIDLLSYYKINTFRWHLTEDQGWRIEIKKYPELTKVGAWRTEADGTRYGGYYTQEQIKDVVEYARIRNITVIPEIEMPGHSMAALAAYPELSCRMKPIKVTPEWGVHKDVFCAGNDGTFTFLQDVLDEVVALFPSPYIHIGGDEVPKDRWRECPKCQLRIKTEGLKDEHGLQSYFIKRIQSYLAKKGKTLIGWDEILEGGADKNAVIEVWRGDAEAAKALENGNRVIMAGPFYFDTPLQSKTLKDVYLTDLLSLPQYRENRSLLLGAEAPLWTERVTTVDAESKLYPRIQAFAEVTWAGKHNDLEDFKRRLNAHYRYLDSLGLAYGPEDKAVANYKISFDAAKRVWRLDAEGGFDDIVFRYTTDGTEPSSDSSAFKNSIEFTKPSAIKAAPFRRGRKYELSKPFTLTANKALGKPVKFTNPIDKRYSKAGAMALTDGILGSGDFSDGIWAGWQGADLDATIDLGQITEINSISADFLQQSGSWIILPRTVTFYASGDGENWTELQNAETKADAMDMSSAVRTIRFLSARPISTRYVRIKAIQFGKLPPGHNGEGGDSWIFADEIVVN